ncbi:hypothetical protein V1281_001859 [Nitrobacteraceae bacterium AZCC 2161]
MSLGLLFCGRFNTSQFAGDCADADLIRCLLPASPSAPTTADPKRKPLESPCIAGLNVNVVNCARVTFCPRLTGVTPSASSIVPWDGNAVTVTVKSDGE